MDNLSAVSKFIPIKTEKPAIEFLHQFLPYDPATKIAKALFVGLKEYQLLLNAALEAIREFQQGKLRSFDSLVGENACEIRAVRLALIATQRLVDVGSLEQRIADALAKLQECLAPKKIAALMLKKISLHEVLSIENLTVPLTRDEVFLIQSFLLTESKELCENNLSSLLIRKVACPKKLRKFGDVSSAFTYELVKKLRQDISLDSVHFIREAAMTSNDELLKKMVSDQFTKQHLNCTCIPMFWANKPLLTLLQEERIPLIIHVKVIKVGTEGFYAIGKEICLYYGHGKNYESVEFIETPLTEIDADRPSIVFQGVVVIDENTKEDFIEVEWKNAMKSNSITDMILASAADHRQYPDSESDQYIFSLNDQEYHYYKKMSDQWGFSLKNPSLFFVQHIYTVLPKILSFVKESVFV